jgi:hypothetical protein
MHDIYAKLFAKGNAILPLSYLAHVHQEIVLPFIQILDPLFAFCGSHCLELVRLFLVIDIESRQIRLA